MGAGHHHDHGHDHGHDHLVHDRHVLWIVLALNGSMFFLELWQGIIANSTSLIADSMDFFSDALSYIITLYVLNKHLHIRAKAAIFKAGFMLFLAAGALGQGGYNLWTQEIPEYQTMGWVAALAFIINLISAMLLFGSRNRDSNMRSVWLCSRNDMLANIFILIAAYLVFATNSLYPDLIVALIIAYLEGGSALTIIKEAKQELRS